MYKKSETLQTNFEAFLGAFFFLELDCSRQSWYSYDILIWYRLERLSHIQKISVRVLNCKVYVSKIVSKDLATNIKLWIFCEEFHVSRWDLENNLGLISWFDGLWMWAISCDLRFD